MVRTLGNIAKFLFLAAILLGVLASVGHAQQDPPSRVARLNHIEGNVSMEPAGVDDWAPAEINRPFTTGDYLYTDQGARAELHMDVAVLRMGSQTSFGFLNLNDQAVQIKLSEGDMYFQLHDLQPGQTFEVDTPNAAVALVANGTYRFRVDPNGSMSYVVVRQGQAQITGGGQAIELDAGNSATLSGTDQLAYDVEGAPAPDDFDNWCSRRDAHESQLAARRYVPATVTGYEDLDDYGTWQQSAEYGPVWYPSEVPAGWAPYHDGHWAWIDPWGWTWVDDAPWGFAPFHYGRWAYTGGRWGWCPGPIAAGYGRPVVRPYYAPALVAWFGGSHWGVSISSGGGPSLGWVPLGYGEPYTPPYIVSQRYFNNVNVSNTRITQTNITNVYNTVYVNHTVYNQQFVNAGAPGAVMAMPQNAFASGRPVQQLAIPVRQANPATLRAAAVVTPSVAPTRQALAPALGRPAPRPAPQVVQRPVVATRTPPTPPAPFTARQQYLQQHAGQLHNYEAMHQAVGAAAKQAAPAIKTVTSERPVPVHAGSRVGNVQAAAQPVQAPPPGQPAANQPRPGPMPANQATRNARPATQAGRPGGFPEQQQRPPAQVEQPGVGAAHGTPPNMRPGNTAQPAENPRATERPQPQGQPPATNERVPQQTQPERQPPARTQPQPYTPAAHGTPPNMRPGNTAQAPENPRVTQRAQPEPTARPTPAPPVRTEARPTPPPQPRGQERVQPEPAARPTPEPPVRTEAKPAPPPQPRGQERVQPEPTARPRPEPPARTEARPTPPPQEHGAPPQIEHHAPPRDTKDTRDHR